VALEVLFVEVRRLGWSLELAAAQQLGGAELANTQPVGVDVDAETLARGTECAV
jgi:hypothetical protein